MKQRLLVMNGQRIVQLEQGGTWLNHKVEKAAGLKPGFYNLYSAVSAQKDRAYAGSVVHVDANHVYQQVGRGFVAHALSDFDKAPEVGTVLNLAYDGQGRVQASDAAQVQEHVLGRGRRR